jgi:hypothetical protein
MMFAAKAPFGGTPARGRRPTLVAMNDPWPLLIAALSGQRTNIPSTWPVRTVHRLDGYVSGVRAAQQSHRSLQQETPLQLAR